MKKFIAMLLALVMVSALFVSGSAFADNQHFDKLTLEFVPSKDADVIIAGTANLPELVKAEMANLGYDIDRFVGPGEIVKVTADGCQQK